jgi:hypothetical protein
MAMNKQTVVTTKYCHIRPEQFLLSTYNIIYNTETMQDIQIHSRISFNVKRVHTHLSPAGIFTIL